MFVQHPLVHCLLPLLLLAGSVAPAQAAEGGAAGAEGGAAALEAACTATVLTHESREVRCSVSAATQARRYRLQIRFSGGHDDTIASIGAPTIDGVTQQCAAGSKTRLVGEDGDVSVDCLVCLAGGVSTRQFVVIFQWTHAEVTGFAMTSF